MKPFHIANIAVFAGNPQESLVVKQYGEYGGG
jgi:hypothetical protein